MKVVLSRKGFDSESGGTPSPIFPDMRMLSLPIPSKLSTVRYEDILWKDTPVVGEMVESLTKRRIPRTYRAHLDPDLNPDISVQGESRHPNWRPLFGQDSAAQSHLHNQGVGPDDIFLFFGLFREVTGAGPALTFCQDGQAKHVIWGWLQIGEVVKVADCKNDERYSWAWYHPHFRQEPDERNVLYIARRTLSLNGVKHGKFRGAGVFPRYMPDLRLTLPNSESVSSWQLPEWFHPDTGRALTYHRNPQRWSRQGNSVLLEAVARGQEFVFDFGDDPTPIRWIWQLLESGMSTGRLG